MRRRRGFGSRRNASDTEAMDEFSSEETAEPERHQTDEADRDRRSCNARVTAHQVTDQVKDHGTAHGTDVPRCRDRRAIVARQSTEVPKTRTDRGNRCDQAKKEVDARHFREQRATERPAQPVAQRRSDEHSKGQVNERGMERVAHGGLQANNATSSVAKPATAASACTTMGLSGMVRPRM